MQEQILGDYRIVRQIGVGTLGSVLLAEHRFIKKPYVLKVLPAELSQDSAFVERFKDEVAKLAHLDHPHIVKIHNVSSAEGFYFLVTDCIVDSIGETTNLAHYMSGRKERLREDELLSVTKQLADALDYAHTKGGIIHHSLKLNNILIGHSNLGMNVFISDFGLAKIISTGKVVLRTFKVLADAMGLLPLENKDMERYAPLPVDGDKMTKISHSFLQSFAFLAPEQKRFEKVGVQADTFAFGILIYFLITGQFPEGKFPMPSEIATNYQYDWDALVSLCLNQDPMRRPTQLLPLLEQKKNVEEGRRKWIRDSSSLHIALKDRDCDVAREQKPQPHMSDEYKIHSSLDTEQNCNPSSEVSEEIGSKIYLENFELNPSMRSASPQVVEREETTLKPIIQRSVDKLLENTPAPVVVSAVIGAEDKQSGVENEESYAGKLNAMLNRELVVTQYQPEKKENHETEPIQSEMIVVRGGFFFRGSNSGNRDEMPRHKISLDGFALDIHPVTNEQFVRFLVFMGSEKDQNYNDLIRLKDSRLARSGGKLSIESGYSKHPVVGVTWYGALAYAKWAGKRLPTEAEWEVAACGGQNSSDFPTGEQIEKGQANFFSSDTTPVMSYAPNVYGLYDMAGNVYEWCQDWYGYNYYETSAQEPRNPKGPQQGVYRVLRGGCWKSLQEDTRCSHRHRNNPGTVNSTYGFRCAADVSA